MNRGVLTGKTLRYERQLAHPIDRVWHVLTDEAETEYWFPGKIIGPREVGAKVKFQFGPRPPGIIADDFAALIASKQAGFDNAPPEVFEGTIEAFDPPTVFALDWAGDKVRFELSAKQGGTHVLGANDLGQVPADQGEPVAVGQLARPGDRLDLEDLPQGLGNAAAVIGVLIGGVGWRQLVDPLPANDDRARHADLGHVEIGGANGGGHDADLGPAPEAGAPTAVIEAPVRLGQCPGQGVHRSGREVGSAWGVGGCWGQTGVRLGSDSGQTGVRLDSDPNLTQFRV